MEFTTTTRVKKQYPKKVCHHNIVLYTCIDCKGKGICEHNRRKTQCKDCKGSQICKHNELRYYCIDCDGIGICEHKKRRDNCRDCRLSKWSYILNFQFKNDLKIKKKKKILDSIFEKNFWTPSLKKKFCVFRHISSNWDFKKKILESIFFSIFYRRVRWSIKFKVEMTLGWLKSELSIKSYVGYKKMTPFCFKILHFVPKSRGLL